MDHQPGVPDDETAPPPTDAVRGGPRRLLSGRTGGAGPGPAAEPPGPSRVPWRSSLVVTLFAVAGTGFAAHGQPDRVPPELAGRGLVVAAGLLLLVRHRHPSATALATAAVTLVYLGAGYPYGPALLPFGVAVFAAVAAGHRHTAWAALGLLWGGHLLIAHWLYAWLPPAGDRAASWTQQLPVAAFAAATLAGAEVVRVRREQRARERAERAAARRRRADEERLRIARELHDVLAHSLAVINVQAGAGLALLDSDPEQARTALATIKAASKEALGEVRQVLDTLRAPGTAPRAPAPGLDRLPELVAQAAAAGLAVEVTAEEAPAPGAPATGRGAPRGLPRGADLAAFRIVQEALTNVVRHSGSRTARVRITRAPDHLALLVDDDGPATGADAGGSGNGLAGMRERAAALGGTIEAGTRPDGGFRVRAVLPLTGSGTLDDSASRTGSGTLDDSASRTGSGTLDDGEPRTDSGPRTDGQPRTERGTP
ncbi:sensor histidine kinase [Streptomyces sp. enrichment culture]|uniref:sensor histidine kinase n=1 Tax=Streptomyces sp. enrichment culture TaxID=1795815 RepID=UPI003F5569CA